MTQRTSWHFYSRDQGGRWYRALAQPFSEEEVINDLLTRFLGDRGFSQYTITVIDTHIIEMIAAAYQFRWYGPNAKEGVS